MNTQSTSKQPSIQNWLNKARLDLQKAEIETASLDSSLILALVLNQNQTYLHAHGDQTLSSDEALRADHLLALRSKRLPFAYISGVKEFYGLDYIVSPNTLIPRPESESLITLLASSDVKQKHSLIDVGTGSGCLGITAKIIYPNLSVTLSDISEKSLIIARQNADKHSAKIQIVKSNLLQNISTKYDIIIANLPYVDKSWDVSPETRFEPQHAIFADESGLKLIKDLIAQAPQYLNRNAIMILEADPCQHDAIIDHANNFKFEISQIIDYGLKFRYLG
jgi:release factor glutamine methyltransferase